MKSVKGAANQFVNLDHVVEFTYSPASTRTERVRDEHDHDISKNTHIELGSSLTITLSTGKQITFYSADADAVYAKLIA
jgi:hypothetical protein